MLPPRWILGCGIALALAANLKIVVSIAQVVLFPNEPVTPTTFAGQRLQNRFISVVHGALVSFIRLNSSEWRFTMAGLTIVRSNLLGSIPL